MKFPRLRFLLTALVLMTALTSLRAQATAEEQATWVKAADNKIYAFKLPVPAAVPYVLRNSIMMPGGAFQFSFTNTPGTTFSVFETTNLAAPFANWSPLGPATETAPGQFRFTDSPAAHADRYYRVSSP